MIILVIWVAIYSSGFEVPLAAMSAEGPEEGEMGFYPGQQQSRM
jgi:hypothetical protein